MSFVRVNFVKYGKAFGGFSVPVLLQISGKYLLDLTLNF